MNDPPCMKTGDGEYDEVCGPWAITYWYWYDGGELLGDFYTCAADWTCNELTVRAYLNRYVTADDATCETYARTHVGGPSGSTADYTLPYWDDVEKCLMNNTMPLR